MTTSRPVSTWPIAVGCWFGGFLCTAVTAIVTGAVADELAAYAGTGLAEVLVLAAVATVVVVAIRLPRRARAMFIAGVVTPIVLGIAFVVWLIWAFSQSNFTF